MKYILLGILALGFICLSAICYRTKVDVEHISLLSRSERREELREIKAKTEQICREDMGYAVEIVNGKLQPVNVNSIRNEGSQLAISVNPTNPKYPFRPDPRLGCDTVSGFLPSKDYKNDSDVSLILKNKEVDKLYEQLGE